MRLFEAMTYLHNGDETALPCWAVWALQALAYIGPKADICEFNIMEI